MAAKEPSFKILMFPWLGHGHVSPYLELAKKLCNKNFHVYFCSTSVILDSIRQSSNKDSSNDFSIELVELHLPSLPELCPQYHTTKNIPPHLLSLLINAFEMSSSSFSDIISDLKPDLLIYDISPPWSARIASSLGIPSVHFNVIGSTSFSFFLHGYTHKNYDTFPFQAIKLTDYENNLIPDAVKVDGEDFAFGAFDLSTDIVLIKGCRAIEAKYIDYFSTLLKKKVVPTGPLIAFSDTNNIQENGDIMNWLDQKSECSTLYISFGSENYFSKEQIGEIAKGLEVSNVNFIWVLRLPSGSDIVIDESLPKGFLERVKNRGIVLQKWAPQTAILAHPSVGGFMSHCGGGSITESIYFGIPVLALPLKLEQPVNARMVGQAGVGVEVMRDDNGGFDGEGVAKAIKEVFVKERGEELRRKAREMSEKMKMEEEEEAIDEVVKELSRICMKK